jgi:hypothetical protein
MQCKSLGQIAAPFLPQWWMSATQMKSGRKSPKLKPRPIRKLEVKIRKQISICAAEDSAPPVANGPIKRTTEQKREAEGG